MAINMLSEQPVKTPKEALEMRVSDLEARLHLLALEVKKLTSDNKRNGFNSATELKLMAAAAGE